MNLTSVEKPRDFRITLHKACSEGGGATLSMNEDGTRCVVAGRESLRILKVDNSLQADGSSSPLVHGRVTTGPGDAQVHSSHNYWKGSGLQIDSAFTDVCWGASSCNNRVFTSSRNGEVHIWDLGKGSAKIERKCRPHSRSIHDLTYTAMMPQAVFSGSHDGSARMWDLRMAQPSVKFMAPSSSPVRSLVLTLSSYASSSLVGTLICGIENGALLRFDLRAPTRVLDRVHLAHKGPIMSLSWRRPISHLLPSPPINSNSSYAAAAAAGHANPTIGAGYLASAGLDRTVKIWSLSSFTAVSGASSSSSTAAQFSTTPTPIHVLHPSFPVRGVVWRPGVGNECEIGVWSADEGGDDPVEIWDVRRPWIPKWRVDRNGAGSGTSDISFPTPRTLWTVNANGSWHQLPIATMPDFNAPATPSSAPAYHISLPVRPKLTRTLTREGAFSTLASLMTSKSSSEPTSAEISRDASLQALDVYVASDSSADSDVSAGGQEITCCSKPVASIPKVALAYSITGTIVYTEFDRSRDLGILRSQSDIPYDDDPPTHRKHPEGPTYATSQVLRWARVPAEDKQGFAKLASAYRIEWNGLVEDGAKEMEGKSALCKWNARISIKAGYSEHASLWWLLFEILEDSALGPRRGRAISYRRRPTNPTKSTSYLSVNRNDLPNKASVVPSEYRTHGGRRSRTSRSPAISRKQHIVGRGALGYSDSEETDSDMGSPRLYAQSPSPRPSLSHHISQPSSSLMRSPSLRVVPLTWSPLRQTSTLSDEDSPSEDRDSDERLESSQSDEDDHSFAFHFKDFVYRPGTVKVIQGPPTPTSVEGEREGRPPTRSVEALRSDVADLGQQGVGSVLFDRLPNSKDPPTPPVPSSNFTLPSMTKASILGGLFPSYRNISAPATDVANLQHEYPTRETSAATVVRRPLPKSPTIAIIPLQEENWEAQIPLHPKQMAQTGKRSIDSDWKIVKEEFERFSEEGNVLMCAHLSNLFGNELGVPDWQRLGYLEAYLERLSRYQLHVPAAYVRKNTTHGSILERTQTQTTFYTSCGRCGKAIETSSSSHDPGSVPDGGFAFCTNCHRMASQCSICQLPVRGLWIHCSGCSHGGHQLCYRRFYSTVSFYPPQTKPSPTTRPPLFHRNSNFTGGSSELFPPSDATGERKIHGLPCAAGCGHWCFIGEEDILTTPPD